MTQVLVVDDDRNLAETLGELLELEGMQVRCAQSVMQACEWLDRHDFDVVVSDYKMPALTGMDLYERLVREPVLRGNVRLFVLITAFQEVDLPTQSSASPEVLPARLLRKPFDIESLLSMVDHGVRH